MPAGRPPKYESAEQLQVAIDEYFDSNPTLTITGLCLHLGFESRQSFYDLQKVDEFSYTIKKARMRIESAYEELLQTKAFAGAIFALKNFGWTDKQTIEHEGKLELPRIILSEGGSCEQ